MPKGRTSTRPNAATAILESNPVISSQVVTETISTLTRKYGFKLTEAHEVALGLIDLCEVVPVMLRNVRCDELLAQSVASNQLRVAAGSEDKAVVRTKEKGLRHWANVPNLAINACSKAASAVFDRPLRERWPTQELATAAVHHKR